MKPDESVIDRAFLIADRQFSVYRIIGEQNTTSLRHTIDALLY